MWDGTHNLHIFPVYFLIAVIAAGAAFGIYRHFNPKPAETIETQTAETTTETTETQSAETAESAQTQTSADTNPLHTTSFKPYA